MTKTAWDGTSALNKLYHYKKCWELVDDGEVIETHSSLLQPVMQGINSAMLKIPLVAEELRSSMLMVCWDGNGAAKVYKFENGVLLMERAAGSASLKQMVLNGDEDKANKILCRVVSQLHAAKCRHNVDLVPLPVWFGELRLAADKVGGVLAKCNDIACLLLNEPINTVVLHGDIHYENILDAGTRGWIAIDPKGLTGERGFDFANIFCNPDFITATSRGRLPKQVKLISAEAGLEPKRLLNWIIAWAGLSTAFSINDGSNTTTSLAVAQIAINELNNF